MMPLYTVEVVVTVDAEDKREALGYIKHVLAHAKQAEIEFVDWTVLATTYPTDDTDDTDDEEAQ